MKNVIRISENDLGRIIKEETLRYLSENSENEEFTWKDPFGTKTMRQNRIDAFSYARQYNSLYQQIKAIADEVSNRVEKLSSGQGQINEAGGGILARLGFKGAKAAMKAGASKGAARGIAFGQKAMKHVGRIGLLSIPAFIAGPENVAGWFQKLSDPTKMRPKDVITAYDELTVWMQNICQAIQEHPEILGANSLDDEVLNGPEEAETAGFDVADGVELAAGIGVAFIPYVGWALSLLDIAHSLVFGGAASIRDGLATVQKQIEYLKKAISGINKALSGKTTAKQQQTSGNDAGNNTYIPQGYVLGRPAPFADNDPEQIKRFQRFAGVQITGTWDRQTQRAWDNWLQKRYWTRAASQTSKRTAVGVASQLLETRK